LEHKPFVPEKTDLKEFTFRAVFFGAIFAIVLGAANAYLGLKVGLTVAATFPAAVMAMAVLKGLKGSVLEENIFRTTAAVGEALVAGAIFTIPAFLIAKDPATGKPLWDHLHYFESTVLMLLGGILGVLFVSFLRKVLVEDATLPFPESVACAEIVKAGQGGASGAKYVFGSILFAAFLEFIKNPVGGLALFKDSFSKFIHFKTSAINFLTTNGKSLMTKKFGGGLLVKTPNASPAMLGVGYIIGYKPSAIVFSGGVFAWLLFVPLLNFIFGGNFESLIGQTVNGVVVTDTVISGAIWNSIVRPFAVGAMLVGAFYTLYSMRESLWTGIKRGFKDLSKIKEEVEEGQSEVSRLEQDLPFKFTIIAIFLLVIPIAMIYYFFCKSVIGAIVAALVMTLAGFLFAAVAGFLVGTIGSSNNPISGLTLSTLIVAALIMVTIGVKGGPGIAAVLGVAAVVCTSSGVAGDIMQDLKVGHIIGGTPWKMEIACIIGVIAASLVMVFPMQVLHTATPGGIGGPNLPAPQAGLMAMLAEGIVGGQMAWPLVLTGIGFSIGMILIGAPSPMLIAVGMYLPLESTFAIFVGGIIRVLADRFAEKSGLDKSNETFVNTGTLIASGLIAGEALMGMGIAAIVAFRDKLHIPNFSLGEPLGAWGGLLVFLPIAYLLIKLPINAAKRNNG